MTAVMTLQERSDLVLTLARVLHVNGQSTDPARHMVGLATDDITTDWKRLKNAGVEFVEDPTQYGNVWVATFKDPEGNLLQLLQFDRSSGG